MTFPNTLIVGGGVVLVALLILHGLARWAERRALRRERRADVLGQLNKLRPNVRRGSPWGRTGSDH